MGLWTEAVGLHTPLPGYLTDWDYHMQELEWMDVIEN